MPGPLPKNPVIRRGHGSRKATRSLLPASLDQRVKAPKLPPLPDKGKWHPRAAEFWRLVWASPMAGEYIDADLPGLLRAAVLVNEFWHKPSVSLSAELRLLSMQYGLAPIDRRRLEWTIAKADDATGTAEHKRSQRAKVVENDPRGVLDQ